MKDDRKDLSPSIPYLGGEEIHHVLWNVQLSLSPASVFFVKGTISHIAIHRGGTDMACQVRDEISHIVTGVSAVCILQYPRFLYDSCKRHVETVRFPTVFGCSVNLGDYKQPVRFARAQGP